MPVRLTIEQIKEKIEEYDVNNDCILLSTTYKNSSEPLLFYCNSCGSIFQRDWGHLRQRKIFCCQKCAKKRAAKRTALTIENIKNFIKENDTNNDCTLLSNFYENNTTPLQLKCNKCGKIFERDWQHLSRGRFQCPECGKHQGAISKKYTMEEVQKDIEQKGYRIIGEYINAATPFDVICKNNHKTQLIYSQYRAGRSGCKRCRDLVISGENHWNWKGGSTEVRDYLRKSIKNWKRDVLIKDGFSCVFTNTNKDIVVHHIQSYNTLLNQASINTGIPILSKFSDYENHEYDKLKDELVKLHKIENGITLSRSIHDLFHSLYGKGNNTKEQFDEFTQRYLTGEFKEKLQS